MSTLLLNLDLTGERLLHWALWMNVWTLAIALVAFAADRAFASRLSPGWRAALYLAVLARLVLPVELGSPLGLRPGTTPGFTAIRPAGEQDPAPANPEPARAFPLMSGLASDTTPMQSPPPSPRMSWAALAPPVYAAGVVLLIARWWAVHRRFARLVRRDPTPRALHGLPVVEHDSGPALVGLFKPVMIMPRALLDRPDPSVVEWILRHEHAHLTARDHWKAAALHAVVIAAWPVLAAWLAAARLRALIELACDSRVLRTAGPDTRAQYARALCLSATTSARSPRPALRFGDALAERLRALPPAPRWPRAVQMLAALGLCSLALACAGTRNAAQPPTLTHTAVFEGAEPQPFKGSIGLTVTVLNRWPDDHPKLEFMLPQQVEDFGPKGPPPASLPMPPRPVGEQRGRILSESEARDLIAQARDQGGLQDVSRLELTLAQPAALTRTDTDDQGIARRTQRIDATIAAITSEPASGGRWDHTLNFAFRHTSPQGQAVEAHARGLTIPGGCSAVFKAVAEPGSAGAQSLLVIVTPRPTDATLRSVPDAPAASPHAGEYPLVHLRASVDEVSDAQAVADIVQRLGAVATPMSGPQFAGRATPWRAWLMPRERLPDLATALAALPGFIKGSTPEAWLSRGESCDLLPPGPDATAGLRLTPRLDPPADREGPLAGGALRLDARWTPHPGSIATALIQGATLENYNAAAHEMILVVVVPPPVGAPAERARVLLVIAERLGSEAEMPVQTMSTGEAEPTITLPR